MRKRKKAVKPKLARVLLGYGFHIWFLLFLTNVVILYAVHFHTIGQTCLTTDQISQDNRCLYVLSNKVFEKGSRASPHHGHPCGSDVTSIIPSFHTDSPAQYLDPNYVGDICTAAVPTAPPPSAIPTAPPSEAPTNTPTPTVPMVSAAPISSVPASPTSEVPSPACLGNCPTLSISGIPGIPDIGQDMLPGASGAAGIPGGNGGGGGLIQLILGFFAIILQLFMSLFR